MNGAQQVNLLPLNQAALKFLPPEWKDLDRLHVLSLMQWGIEGAGLAAAAAPHLPTSEQIDQHLLKLSRMSPKQVMRLLEDPENHGSDATILPVSELKAQQTPQDAANYLLQGLIDGMVAMAP